ncbi:DMT family transporter [Vibrio lentus]|nr:DMT family transporter [Vibrio lentus]
MTKAMKNAEVTLVMILDFFRLPAIAVVGILLYDEPLTPALIIGGVVMLFGNLLVTYKKAIAAISERPRNRKTIVLSIRNPINKKNTVMSRNAHFQRWVPLLSPTSTAHLTR